MLLLFLTLLVVPTLAITVWHHALKRMSSYTWAAYQITGAIGSPIHELSHLAACLLFRLPVHQVALYTPRSTDGCLGYVTFAHNPRSILNNVGMAVQGVAPLIAGTAIVRLLLHTPPAPLFPKEIDGALLWLWTVVSQTATAALSAATSGFGGAITLAGLLIVAMHSIPSWADVRVGLKGLVLLVITAVFVAAGVEIAGSYFHFGNEAQSIWAQAAQLFAKGLQECLHGAVQLITLSVAGGLSLIVLPGQLWGAGRKAAVIAHRVLRRHQ